MSPLVYIGIDSTPGTPPFALAVLDGERRLAALSQGPLEEMLAYTAGQAEAIVAISAPPRPNQGLVGRQQALPQMDMAAADHPHLDMRLAEHLLRQKGFDVPRTPAHPARGQGWLLRSFDLYDRLQSLGYQAYPADSARRWLETQSNACFQSLLGVSPFAAGTLEGRLQRQLALRDQHLPVPDAMNFFEEVTRHKLLHGILPTGDIYSAGELNALMAAQVAWLAAHKPDRLVSFGESTEGVVYLPIVSNETEK